MKLYFENKYYNVLTEVDGPVASLKDMYSLIRENLSKQVIDFYYLRHWIEEDAQMGWCIVTDYGSHSNFFKLAGFSSDAEATAFMFQD